MKTTSESTDSWFRVLVVGFGKCFFDLRLLKRRQTFRILQAQWCAAWTRSTCLFFLQNTSWLSYNIVDFVMVFIGF